jgi:drug/metabolite transporter (DMT)-like permease
MAFLILNEKVVVWQWCGILLIILAIVIMNLNFSKKEH